MNSAPILDTETRDYLSRMFNDAACERLAASSQDYYSTHGDYIVPLAKLLLLTRKPLREARGIVAEPETASFLAQSDRFMGQDEALDMALSTLLRLVGVLSETPDSAGSAAAETKT